MIVSELNTIPGFNCIPPEGCYVAFVDIRGTGKTSQEIHDLLLTKGKVAVVPGLEKWFGSEAEGFIRICFSTSERILRESIQRIKYALA